MLLISACAQQAPAFAPPSQRPVAANEKPWPKNHVLGIAYHDIEDRDPDQAVVAVRTERMIEQLAWLRENGYQPVTVDQIMAARKGGPELPAKAILLSFDDGYSSFYTRVLPVLRAYNWHALLAPVGVWIDTPLNQPVDFAGAPRVRRSPAVAPGHPGHGPGAGAAVYRPQRKQPGACADCRRSRHQPGAVHRRTFRP